MHKNRPADSGAVFMAGGVGIEPTLMVLETIVLPLYEPPKPIIADDWKFENLIPKLENYLVSLCKDFFLQNLQNFCNSSRFWVFFLFFFV